jgi:hypothetical protein
MSAVIIKPIKLKMNEFVEEETSETEFVAVNATDGAVFEMPDRDEKYIIGVQNGHESANVTAIIKAGDGLQCAFGDVSHTLAAGEIAWITLDSGRFKNILGDNKGKVVIQSLNANGSAGTTDLKVKVIKLP